MKKRIVAVLFAAAAAGAHAQTAVGVKLGTPGLGLDLAHALAPTLTLRANANALDWSKSFSKSDVDYDGDVRLRTFGVLADWHPWRSGFRVSVGAYLNRNEIDLTGEPESGTIELNGQEFAFGPDVGSVDAQIEFDRVAPYVGLGWGNPTATRGGWGFYADVGVLYQRSPDVSLRAVCGPALQAAGQCATLEAQRAAEEASLRDDVKDYKWFPVVAVGVAYAF